MKDKVIEILKEIKPDQESFENVGLISQGILDSFDIIALCEAFYSKLGKKIKGSDIIPENFETIDDIVSMLSKI